MRWSWTIFIAHYQNNIQMPEPKPNPLADDKPPIFQTWNQVYAFVLITHLVIIALFYLFKVTYS